MRRRRPSCSARPNGSSPTSLRRSCSAWSTRRRSRARRRRSSTTWLRPTPWRSASTCSATTTRGHHVSEPETLRRAAEGDGDAIGEILEAYSEYLDPEKCSDAEAVLRADPAESKRALLDLLSGWSEHVLPDVEPADYPALLERDAEAKRELVRSVPPSRSSSGWRPASSGCPGRRSTASCSSPPTRRARGCTCSEYKRVKIFCPPITADRERSPGDPAELVRIYKALGDESRLKLLKRLQEGRSRSRRRRRKPDSRSRPRTTIWRSCARPASC